MTQALQSAKDYGYDISKINASRTNNEIVWDSDNDVFCYVNEGKLEYLPDSVDNNKKLKADSYKLWKIYADAPKAGENFSIYVAGQGAANYVNSNYVNVGVDCGDYTIQNVSYKNDGEKRDVVIRTNGTATLTIDAPKDTVYHYEKVDLVDIKSVDSNASYHERGEVSLAKIANGRIVVTEEAKIGGIHAVATEDDFNDIKIAVVGNAEVPAITRDAVSEDSKTEEGTYTKFVLEVQTIATETTVEDNSEYVWISVVVDGEGEATTSTEVATSKTSLTEETKITEEGQSVVAKAVAEATKSTMKIYDVRNESELSAALGASEEKVTINIIDDFEITSVGLFSRDTTIFGSGHEIKGKATRVFRMTVANLNVKIYSLKITSICTATSDVRGISFDNASAGSSLLLDGCSVSASFYVINAVPGADNLNITVKNGTVAAGWAALNIYSANSTITIENATLKGLNDKNYNSDGWNNFNTITIDGGGHQNAGSHPAGECGYNNTINIVNSTIYASSSSGNKQYWVGLQYNAINNKVIVDQKSKSIDVFGNDQINNFYVGSLPNSIVVNGNELLRQPDAYYTNAAANYNEGNITSTSPTNEMNCYFESPFINGWLADGEGVRLLSDIELSSNVTLQMTSGSIYLIFDGHTIIGGKIVLQDTASVISENGNMSSVFEGNVTVIDNQDGSYTYSLSE
jgi:hypothetical protein